MRCRAGALRVEVPSSFGGSGARVQCGASLCLLLQGSVAMQRSPPPFFAALTCFCEPPTRSKAGRQEREGGAGRGGAPDALLLRGLSRAPK